MDITAVKKRLSTIEDLREFLQEFFRDQEVEVYLFGSRAKETFHPGSDIDLAIISHRDLSEDLAILREILEESRLPYKVDLVDVRFAPHIKDTALREGEKWV